MDKPVVEIKSLEDSSSVNKINEFLKSEKITKILEWCFFILGCIQFLMICFVNLTQNQNHLGFDASTFYLRAVESFNQHSLFLDNWVEQTTLMIDSPIPLASLLYGITGNIFISYGLSNIVTVVLFVALAICVLKEINMPRLGGIITLNFILSPYVTPFYNNANPIDYFPSMFIGAAFYSVKMVICLAVFYCVLRIENNKKGLLTGVMLIGSLLLVFISSLSSGLYICITVVVPIFVYLLIKTIVNHDIRNLISRTLGLLIVMVVISLIGKSVATNVIGFTSNESGMVLVGFNDFWNNIGSIFLGFANLMGTMWLTSDTKIFSTAGICLLINWVLFAILIVSVVYCIKRIKQTLCNENSIAVKNSILLAISIVAVNLAIFVLSLTTYGSAVFEVRYLIPIFLILCFTIGILFISLNNKLLKVILSLGIIVILSLSNLISYKSYLSTNLDSYIFEIPEKLSAYDVPFVYSYGDDLNIITRDLRVIDTTKKYKLIAGSGNSPYHWGDYTYYDDNAEYTGQIVLLSTEASFGILPEYLQKQFTLTDTSGNIGIYTCDHNCIDLEAGLPEAGANATELVYTGGIVTANGTIGDDGCFYSDGTQGFALYGPYAQPGNATYDITLNYEVLPGSSETVGVFDVACNVGTVQLGQADITPDSTSVTITGIKFDEGLSAYEYRVFLYEGAQIKISSIDISAY